MKTFIAAVLLSISLQASPAVLNGVDVGRPEFVYEDALGAIVVSRGTCSLNGKDVPESLPLTVIYNGMIKRGCAIILNGEPFAVFAIVGDTENVSLVSLAGVKFVRVNKT